MRGAGQIENSGGDAHEGFTEGMPDRSSAGGSGDV